MTNSKFNTAEVMRFLEKTMVAEIYTGLEDKNFEEACQIKAQGEGPVAEAARRWLIEMDDDLRTIGINPPSQAKQ